KNTNPNSNLLNIYPNPFNELTVISYTLKVSGRASLKIYDMTGQEVRTLVNKNQSAGKHSVVWDGTTNSGKPVSSGIYFCKLNINKKPVSTKKIMLLK
ncbi:MAG: T9SS type A sorting domain-containing protein, partial [Bacteroidales bacterium]|nr:T9SS type A sorting domain-containing protein [Bacteroidales bacterium]